MAETSPFIAFRSELSALEELLQGKGRRLPSDDITQERFQNLYLNLTNGLRPSLPVRLLPTTDLAKLEAEVEALAKLATRGAQKADVRRRLSRAIRLLDALLASAIAQPDVADHRPTQKEQLFLPLIPDLPLSIVPRSLYGWKQNVNVFLQAHPFDKSVFLIIRYRKSTARLISAVKKTLAGIGLEGIAAKDHTITDDLYNPIACLLCCSKAVAVFDQAEKKQEFNPNVAYELGMFHLLNRPCLILKHESLKSLNTDILMKLYKPFRTAKQVVDEVKTWLPSESQG